MAPNLTSNVIDFDVAGSRNDGPLDLTCRRQNLNKIVNRTPKKTRVDYLEQNQNDQQERKSKGKRSFGEQEGFAKRGKSEKKHSEENNFESMRAQTERDSLSDDFLKYTEDLDNENSEKSKKSVLKQKKRNVFLAQKWLNDNVIRSSGHTIAFCTILAAYSQFCVEKNEKRLDDLPFFSVIFSKFSDITHGEGTGIGRSGQLQEKLRKMSSNRIEKLRKIEEKSEELRRKMLKGNNDIVLDDCDENNEYYLAEELQDSTIDSSSNNSMSLTKDFLNELKFQFVTLKQLVLEKDYDSSDSGFESNDQVSAKISSSKMDIIADSLETDFVHGKKVNLNSRKAMQFTLNSSISGRISLDQTFSMYPNSLEIQQRKESNESIDRETLSGTFEILDLKQETRSEVSEEAFKINQIEDYGKVIEVKDLQKKIKENATTDKIIKKEYQEKIITNVIILLQLKGYENAVCIEDAKKFGAILVESLKKNQLQILLQTFSHSMSCSDKQCSSLCFMFKRIFRHITSPTKHLCAVKEMYGHIIRLHLDTCANSQCGMPNCEGLRRMRKGRESKT